jgi:uncharacterized protein YfbU (UPF0304 family)
MDEQIKPRFTALSDITERTYAAKLTSVDGQAVYFEVPESELRNVIKTLEAVLEGVE